MSSARLARSTKSRLFIYICAVLAFGMIVYMFHGSQLQLDDNRKALATCTQQTESLSAQLQVIFEYKLRLEKSLQKEKAEHKQSKEECQNKAKQEKDDREKELVEALNKYSALQQSYVILQSKQKDLEEENNDLRKKKLKLLDDMDIQKKQLTAKLTEEQQIRFNKEKDFEQVKSKQLELEVKYNRLVEENESLKKAQLPESNHVMSLEKTNIQLERELDVTKKKLESCLGGDRPLMEEKKVSLGGVGDNQSGIEPPKLYLPNKSGVNSTTPVINPEAVIEHDVSSPKTSLTKSTKTMVANQEAGKKATQGVAAPLETPLRQPDNEPELNRQIPMPNNQEPQQVPENTVIKKPDYSMKDEPGKKKDELADENQGGEEGNVIARPMNPIQEPVINPLQGNEDKVGAAKHKALAMQWDEEGLQNGAHEEGEEEAVPGHHPGWRGGEPEKVLPKHMKHDYPEGGDYERDNQEEDEDEEGEQMDYLGGEAVPKHARSMAKFRQIDRNGGVANLLLDHK